MGRVQSLGSDVHISKFQNWPWNWLLDWLMSEWPIVKCERPTPASLVRADRVIRGQNLCLRFVLPMD